MIHSPSPEFMSSVWRRGSKTHFLPRLKSLALIDYCPSEVDYKLLLPFLYRRSTALALAMVKLESFKLQLPDGEIEIPDPLDSARFTVPESESDSATCTYPRTLAGHLRELESNRGVLIQIDSSEKRGRYILPQRFVSSLSLVPQPCLLLLKSDQFHAPRARRSQSFPKAPPTTTSRRQPASTVPACRPRVPSLVIRLPTHQTDPAKEES
ncbi:hypothetical protein C8R46DRAFT_1350603 [Mycena filopes]|nr:hypothetical protein C8R46DRAFT_1350603 [Mycena filopes]